MYLGCLIFAAGQGLVVPNYLAGPSFGIGMMLLFALRVGYEERMMFDEFGDEYTAYCKRSNRLIPGIWYCRRVHCCLCRRTRERRGCFRPCL